MNLNIRAALLAAVTLALPATAVVAQAPKAAAHDHNAMLLDQAIAGSHRSAANRARDQYRHPKETLTFFGVKPNMTLVEISPGGGWYTEILAPYLANGGTFYAAAANPAASEGAAKAVANLKTKLAASPATAKAQVTSFGKDHYDGLAPAGSADVVLTFRNAHNWVDDGTADAYFKAFFDALKPGGTLGVVDHRAKPGTDIEKMKTSGYLTEALVIELAQKAGFKLDAKSEVNANPKDTADHPNGVWTLPPSNQHDAKDDAKYKAIGESDRMTLRFVKP